MRNKICSLLISVFVIAALVLTACSSGETQFITKTQCTITFNTAGASTATPETITIMRGGTMGDNYPLDPENDDANIFFYGWWDSGIEYGRDTPINSDLDLTARWVKHQDTVTVTFVTGGNGASEVLPLKVLKGESIGLRMPVSRKKGFTFDGWFSGSTKYTALTPVVNGDITLTAQWTEKGKHTVTFRTNDKNLLTGADDDLCTIAPIQVYEGEGLEGDLPTATHTNPKIKFTRWIGDDNELYDEFTPINEDMTFHAKWGLEPYYVDLAAAELVNGDSYNMDGDTSPTRVATPLYYPETQSIKNSVMYDGAKNRWLILYRIGLGLPADFNMGYYARYTVRAKFYGNNRAILGDPDYSVGYMDDANAITAIGDEMPPKAGYGQISWCVTKTSNGNPGQDAQGVIAQQYNLGTTTINNQWLVGGSYTGSKEDAIRPNYLLIQTSDNWIGWIEITEIIFHNGEDEFVPPPEEVE